MEQLSLIHSRSLIHPHRWVQPSARPVERDSTASTVPIDFGYPVCSNARGIVHGGESLRTKLSQRGSERNEPSPQASVNLRHVPRI
jgi:hypothetical protein